MTFFFIAHNVKPLNSEKSRWVDASRLSDLVIHVGALSDRETEVTSDYAVNLGV